MSYHGRITNKKEQELKNTMTKRSDQRYKKFERISNDDLVNFVVLEFHLRCDDFKKTYNDFEQELLDNGIEHFMSDKYKVIEKKYHDIFMIFGYFTRDLAKYILLDRLNTRICTKNFAPYEERNMIINKGIYINNAATKDGKAYINFSTNPLLETYFPSEEEKQDLVSDLYRFVNFGLNGCYYIGNVPSYNYSNEVGLDNFTIYNTLFKNICINTSQPEDVTLKQVTEIIQAIYKEKDIENIQNSEKFTSLSDLCSNKYQKQSTMAEYFYIYDNLKLDIPKKMIENEINLYRDKNRIIFNGGKYKNISNKTLYLRFKKMNELMQDRNFRYLVP